LNNGENAQMAEEAEGQGHRSIRIVDAATLRTANNKPVGTTGKMQHSKMERLILNDSL